MRIYLVCSLVVNYLKILVSEKYPNLLISFEYIEGLIDYIDELLENKTDLNLMIDSGAFTVWTKGRNISLDEYIEFCKFFRGKYQDKVNSLFFVSLDKIPGSFGIKPTKQEIDQSAQISHKNYLKILEAKLDVIPVYHQHEDMKYLKQMENYTDYIGISPANDLNTQKRMVFMDEVYLSLKNRVKTHSFGGISKKLLSLYPIYSGDSSSWMAIRMYGRNTYFKINKKPLNVKDKKLQDYLLRGEIKEYKKVQSNMTKLWESREVVWK